VDCLVGLTAHVQPGDVLARLRPGQRVRRGARTGYPAHVEGRTDPGGPAPDIACCVCPDGGPPTGFTPGRRRAGGVPCPQRPRSSSSRAASCSHGIGHLPRPPPRADLLCCPSDSALHPVSPRSSRSDLAGRGAGRSRPLGVQGPTRATRPPCSAHTPGRPAVIPPEPARQRRYRMTGAVVRTAGTSNARRLVSCPTGTRGRSPTAQTQPARDTARHQAPRSDRRAGSSGLIGPAMGPQRCAPAQLPGGVVILLCRAHRDGKLRSGGLNALRRVPANTRPVQVRSARPSPATPRSSMASLPGSRNADPTASRVAGSPRLGAVQSGASPRAEEDGKRGKVPQGPTHGTWWPYQRPHDVPPGSARRPPAPRCLVGSMAANVSPAVWSSARSSSATVSAPAVMIAILPQMCGSLPTVSAHPGHAAHDRQWPEGGGLTAGFSPGSLPSRARRISSRFGGDDDGTGRDRSESRPGAGRSARSPSHVRCVRELIPRELGSEFTQHRGSSLIMVIS